MIEPLIVELGERSYPIVFTQSICELIKKYSHGEVAICMDAKLVNYGEAACRELLQSNYPIYQPRIDGERLKELSELGRIYSFLGKYHMSRGALLVVVGGGVIGDMAGFAAATFQIHGCEDWTDAGNY